MKAKTATGGIMAGITGCAHLLYQINKKFPHSGEELSPGARLNNEWVVIGYFGASEQVTKNGIDHSLPLYYGSKKIAQRYAGCDKPMVSVVVGRISPTHKDHWPGRFEGYDPLSPDFCRKAKVRLVNSEHVSPENKIGIGAAAKRAVEYYRK